MPTLEISTGSEQVNLGFSCLASQFINLAEYINQNKPKNDSSLKGCENRDKYLQFVKNLDLPEETLDFLQNFENNKNDFEEFLDKQPKEKAPRMLRILNELSFHKSLEKNISRAIWNFILYKEIDLGADGKSLAELSLQKYGNLDISVYLNYISEMDTGQPNFWQNWVKILKVVNELRNQPNTQEFKKASKRLLSYNNIIIFIADCFLGLRDKTDLAKFTGFARDIEKMKGKKLETVQILFQLLLKRGLTLDHLISSEFPLKILELLKVNFDKDQLKYFGVKSIFLFLNNEPRANSYFMKEQLEKGLISQTLYNRLDAALDRMKNGAKNEMYLPEPGNEHPAIITTKFGSLEDFFEKIKQKEIEIDFFDDKLALIRQKVQQIQNKPYNYANFCWYPEDGSNPDLLKKYVMPLGVGKVGSPMCYAVATLQGIQVVGGCISVIKNFTLVNTNPWWICKYGFESITGHRQMLENFLNIKTTDENSSKRQSYFDFQPYLPQLNSEEINYLNTRAALPQSFDHKEALLILPTVFILDPDLPLENSKIQAQNILEIIYSHFKK